MDFDINELSIDYSDYDLEVELEDMESAKEYNEPKSLVDKFIVPPFSILDTRQGYWQDRKRKWRSIGIRSEEGRSENVLGDSKESEGNWGTINGNKMTIAPNTSIFDPVLCELVYKWFNIDNGVIYDSFAGGSVRGVIAEYLGYKYNGIDLRQEQIDANYNNANEIGVYPNWICDDSLNVDKYIEDNSIDLFFSCPPYADLEVYSNDKRDISNMDYNNFIKVYREIIKRGCNKLKDDRFAVFVVGDVRDRKGFYYNFIDDTKKAFIDCGLKTYNELILLEQSGTGAMRANKTFGSMRKVIKTHQNVLVFYKGDPKKIKENYKEIIIEDLDKFVEAE